MPPLDQCAPPHIPLTTRPSTHLTAQKGCRYYRFSVLTRVSIPDDFYFMFSQNSKQVKLMSYHTNHKRLGGRSKRLFQRNR